MLDAGHGAGRQGLGGPTVGLIERGTPGLQRRLRRLGQAEPAARAGPLGLPGGAVEQPGARITPALARLYEQVPTPQPLAHALKRAERIGTPINPAVWSSNQMAPSAAGHAQGCSIPLGLGRVFQATQEGPGGQDGLAGRQPMQLDRAQQQRQEAPHLAVPPQQLGHIGALVRGMRQLPHRGRRSFQPLARDLCVDRRPQADLRACRIEQQQAGHAQVQGGGIQIPERAQAPPLSLALDARQECAEQHVQQINDVVLRGPRQNGGEGDEGGHAALVRHAGDRLGTCQGGVARQDPHPTGW